MAATVIALTVADVLFEPSTKFDLLLSESTPAVNVPAETVTFVFSEIVSELEAPEPKFALVPAISKFPVVSVVDAFPSAETPVIPIVAFALELTKVIPAPSARFTPPKIAFELLAEPVLRNTSPVPAAVSVPRMSDAVSIVPWSRRTDAEIVPPIFSVPEPVFTNALV